jgi:signal transduction histidine kinase
MFKSKGISDLHKSFMKGVKNIFVIASYIILIETIIETFNFTRGDKYILYINLPTIAIILFILTIYYFNRENYKIGLSILIYTIIANIIIGTFLTTKELTDPVHINFFLRDSLFILLLLTVASFSLHKLHSPIIGLAYLIYSTFFIVIVKNSFLIDNILVLYITIASYIGLIYYLVGMFEKALLEQHEKHIYIKDQNDILNEINVLLKERQQLIEQQSVQLITQKMELEIKNKELYELNATKDKFFSIIAHDIKNPFSTIMGFSDLLLINFDTWKKEKKINTIKILSESSKNLYELLQNLLQWSMSQRGLLEYVPVKLELKSTVDNIVAFMKHSADEKEIEFIVNIPDNNILVFADPKLLDFILRNLFSNAIKFSHNGTQIEIKAEVLEKSAIISVIDKGIGIPDDEKDKLFRIDVHNSSMGTNEEKGTGLGLILVKEFVIKQSGNIWVESEEGNGSSFIFTLPIA